MTTASPQSLVFPPGALVKARGREWVVLPDSSDDVLLVRPIGGLDDEVVGICKAIEPVTSASFSLPDWESPGDFNSCRLLRDAARLSTRSAAGPFRSFGKIAVDPRPYQLMLASYTLETALDDVQAEGEQTVARRCGVTKTKGVAKKTSLLVLRLRYHLKLKRRGGADTLLLAEEVLTVAFTGPPDDPQWLSDADSKHLLDVMPSGNLPYSLVKRQLEHFIGSVDAMRPMLNVIAMSRADELKEAHTRIRRSAKMIGTVDVTPVDKVDILGCFILLPDGNLFKGMSLRWRNAINSFRRSEPKGPSFHRIFCVGWPRAKSTGRRSELKRDNKRERKDHEQGQGYLFSPTLKLGDLPATISQINVASDDSVENVAAKQEMYENLVKGADYLNARLLADTWCAAFVWKKGDSDLGRFCPTERVFRNVEDNPHSINIHVKAEVLKLSKQYQFYHWHLAFPDVFRLPEKGSAAENGRTGRDGGFDVVLGNPPWERVKLQEKEWFAGKRDDIAEASSAAKRRALIAELAGEEPELLKEFTDDVRVAESISHFLRASGQFPFCSRGDVNTFAVFAELDRNLLNIGGHCGSVVPTGIATDDTYKQFIQDIVNTKSLRVFYGFTNRGYTFSGVESTLSFSLFVVANMEMPMFYVAAKLWSVDHLTRHSRPIPTWLTCSTCGES